MYSNTHPHSRYSDLALEAELLASLVHPNIIKLRGISHGGAEAFENGPKGYFLVIDRLFDTLDSRMKRWRNTPKHRRISSLKRSFSNKGKEVGKDEIMDTKLHTGMLLVYMCIEECTSLNDQQLLLLFLAFQISAAISYLHSHSIIFRDLKPANIGFDVRGTVKVFDLGLARIMPANGDPYTDTFDMSGAGSPRYMAPECLVGQPYNLKVDTYSFRKVNCLYCLILCKVYLWQTCSNRS